MRKFARASILTAIATLAVALTGAFATAAPAAAANSVPAQGIFESCPIDTNLAACEQRLQVMHGAGLGVVVFSVRQSSSLANLQAYAQAAKQLGMSIMWEINDPVFWGGSPIGASAAADFSDFSSACGCTATDQVLTYMVRWLAALPNTYGYYAADDESISPGQSGGLSRYVSQIRSLDPGAMVMVGSYPSAGTGIANTGATIGKEVYPVTTNSILPMGRNSYTWDWVQQEISSDQRAASSHGQPSAFILQAFTFGDNLSDGQAVGACSANMSQQACYDRVRYPSGAEQLAMRNEVLRYANPKLIIWYNFEESYGWVTPLTSSYTLYPTGAAANSRWAGLSSAISAPYGDAVAHAANKRHRRRWTHFRAWHRLHGRHLMVHVKTTGIAWVKIRLTAWHRRTQFRFRRVRRVNAQVWVGAWLPRGRWTAQMTFQHRRGWSAMRHGRFRVFARV